RRNSSTAFERNRLLSITAPIGASAATASIAVTAACPSSLEASTSGTGSTDINASLIVSLATSGSESSHASAGASVDFPLAGGPATTTNRAERSLIPVILPQSSQPMSRRLRALQGSGAV